MANEGLEKCVRMCSTRRGFISGGVAASSAGLLPFVGFPAVVKRRNVNSMLCHACVGTGNMALADLKGIRSHRDVHIAALCDVDASFLKRAQKICPDARIYRNAHEMYEKEGNRIDSTNVSTPDHTHAEYVMDALGRGLNVYAQKPLCREVAQCRVIERLAAEKSAVTQMGTQVAAWECDRQTVSYLKKGVIGEVRHIWIFSNRGGHTKSRHEWPLQKTPVPVTLDWKTWLGPAPYRPYAKREYHPGAWRKWRDFGTLWLGDLGLHLLSPLWIGLDLKKSGPIAVTAETPEEAEYLRRQFWPRMSHVVWEMPGCKASGGKPFPVEWCDGNLADEKMRLSTDPKYLPPSHFRELFAKSSIGKQPFQGRVVEGTEGWLLSVHWNTPPAVVMKNGGKPPPLPRVGPACTHWHEWVNACLQGGSVRSSFAWAGRLSEMVVTGNIAMAKSGKRLLWDAGKGSFIGGA